VVVPRTVGSSPVRVVPASLFAPTVLASPPPASGPAPIAWKRVIGVQAGQRPLVVWISDYADAAVEHRTFDDASVRLASRAFRTVRITQAAAKTDPVLALYVKSASAMLVLSPDLKRVAASYEPSLDAGTALAAMRASAKSDLAMDLDAAVIRAQGLIAEEHAVAALRAKLVRTVPADAAKAAEFDRRIAAIHLELDAVLRPPVPAAADRPK
jgi:hypothetical protein